MNNPESWRPDTIFVFVCVLQSVATIGSTLTSVQHDVKTMQTALESQKKEEADEMKKAMVNWIMNPFFNADTPILCKGFCLCYGTRTDNANL